MRDERAGLDRDQRRPGADRRRPDGRDRGAVLRTRDGARRRPGGAHRRDPAADDVPLAGPRCRRRPPLQPQAGGDPAGRDRAGAGGDRAWARRPAGGGPGPTVVVLPGPPRELQPMWETARATEAFRAAIAGAPTYRTRIVRLFGIPESEIANTLRAAEEAGLDLAAAGDHHLPAARRDRGDDHLPAGGPDRYDALLEFIRARHAETLFSEDGSTIDEQVAELLAGRTLAVAESCTGGGLAARLTDRAGSSAYFLGGGVVYSNEAKVDLAGRRSGADRRGSARSRRRSPRPWPRAIAARFDAGLGVGHHGHRRPRRRDRGQAGRAPCASRSGSAATRRAAVPRADHPPHPAARRPGRHPRPLGDGRDAPAAAAVPGGDRRRRRGRRGGRGAAPAPGRWGAVSSERARLFVALDLPAAIRATLAGWAADRLGSISGLRLISQRSLHVTLCFLGWRDADEVGEIAAVCRTAAPTGNSTGTHAGNSTATPTGNSTATPTGNSPATPTSNSPATPTGNSTATPTGNSTATPAGNSTAASTISFPLSLGQALWLPPRRPRVARGRAGGRRGRTGAPPDRGRHRADRGRLLRAGEPAVPRPRHRRPGRPRRPRAPRAARPA